MTRFTMSQTYTYQGVSYSSGQTYQLRARNAKEIINAGKATKSTTKGH